MPEGVSGRAPRPWVLGPALALLAVAGVLLVPARGGVADVDAVTAPLYLQGHLGGPVRSVSVDGDTAWIGEGLSLVGLDITDRRNPVVKIRRIVGPDADVHAVLAKGDWVVVGGADGIHVFALGAGPEELEPIAFLDTPGVVSGLAAHGNRVLASDSAYGVLFLDLDAADGPAVVAGLPVPGGVAGAASVDGDLAVLPGNDLVVVTLPAGGAPGILAQVPTAGLVTGVSLDAGVAYVSDTADGLLAVDLADPTQPRILSRLEGLPGGPLALHGDHLYLGGPGARVLSLADPAAPRDVHGAPGPFTPVVGAAAIGFTAAGDLVAALGTAVQILGLDDPELPRVQGRYASMWPISDYAAAGRYLLVAKGAAGLDVLDASDVEAPVVAVSYIPPASILGVAVDGSSAYLSTTSGAEAVDIAEAANPVPRGTFGAEWPAGPFIAAGAGRIVAAGPASLHVGVHVGGDERDAGVLDYDVVPDWPAAATPRALAVTADRAYMAAGPAGLVVVDIADPDRPAYAGKVDVGDPAEAVVVVGDQVWVGGPSGLAVLDASGPALPQLRGRADMPAGVSALTVDPAGGLLVSSGGTVLAAGVDGGGQPVVAARFGGAVPLTGLSMGAGRVYAVGSGVSVLGNASAATPAPTAATPGATPTPPPTVATARPSFTPSPTDTAEPTSTPVPEVWYAYLPLVSAP